jgi:hypothetical protein
MKNEICLMCIICFLLGYFVADVISKCGFGSREHLTYNGGEYRLIPRKTAQNYTNSDVQSKLKSK